MENKLPSIMYGPERENKGTGIVLPVVAVKALALNLST